MQVERIDFADYRRVAELTGCIPMTDAELEQCRSDGALLFSLVSRKVKLKREGKGCLVRLRYAGRANRLPGAPPVSSYPQSLDTPVKVADLG